MAARREAEAAGEVPAGAGGPGGAVTREQRVLRGDLKPKRRLLAKVMFGLVAIALIGVAGEARRQRPPLLEPNCEKPSFALSSPVRRARPTAFTMVGPPGRRYALGVDTATFVNDGGEWRPVPHLGRDAVVVVGSNELKDCRRTGVLSIAGELGPHTVSMYELTGQSAVEIQRIEVDLVDPDKQDTAVDPPR